MLKPARNGMFVLRNTLLALLLLSLSSCATSVVRSGSSPPSQVYPATAMDAELFWEQGVVGYPMVDHADPDYREGPTTRVVSGLGALIDLPISLVFDTIFLPFDLKHSMEASEDLEEGDR